MTETDESLSRPVDEASSSAPGAPLIVIEYRHRGLSWTLLVPLLLITCTGAVLIYHRVVAEKYRREAAHARADYESLRAQEQAAARPVVVPPSVPLAENSTPLLTTAKSTPTPTLEPAPPPKAAPTPKPVVIVMTPTPESVAAPPVAAPPTEKAKPLSPMGKAIARDLELATANPPPEPPKDPAPKPTLDTEPPPLPTKEENLRQIQAESEELKAKIVQGWQDRAVSARETFLAEQLRFRDEIRQALRSDPKTTGSEIDSLAKRYHHGVDPRLQGMAHVIWESRLSTKDRITRIRALALPETVILNLLSDDLHRLVHTRNGPRDENEVRTRAARILLSHDFPRKQQAGASSSPPANAARSPVPASPTARPLGGS